MTHSLGALHEFHPDGEDFSTYMERVQIFFAANDVPEAKQVPVFLNAVGRNTYGVLRSLLSPDNPMSKSFTDIVAILQNHFEPKPSIIGKRYHFHKRNQDAEESIAEYVAELRRLAAKCSFPRDYLDETLVVDLEALLSRYPDVFKPDLGTMTQIKAHLTLKPNAQPRFCRPRSVPFAIKEKVGKELDRLEEAGVLRKVDHAEWAVPIVPVPKSDGAIRICGDYKVTVNPSLIIDQYPLPKPSDLLTCLTGGQRFTKLDLTAAYQQMLLNKESAKLVTINTHQGLYDIV